MAPSLALRAELSRRLRGPLPPHWSEFTNLWMAFNAIYGGEPDDRERARVIAAVRRFVSEGEARRILRATEHAIDQIMHVPPGNMLLDTWNPRFRSASRRYLRIYRAPRETARTRLAAVAAILYQVRCNLLHGSKDPGRGRDQMLVRECVRVLRELVPAVEDGAMRAVRTSRSAAV